MKTECNGVGTTLFGVDSAHSGSLKIVDNQE